VNLLISLAILSVALIISLYVHADRFKSESKKRFIVITLAIIGFGLVVYQTIVKENKDKLSDYNLLEAIEKIDQIAMSLPELKKNSDYPNLEASAKSISLSVRNSLISKLSQPCSEATNYSSTMNAKLTFQQYHTFEMKGMIKRGYTNNTLTKFSNSENNTILKNIKHGISFGVVPNSQSIYWSILDENNCVLSTFSGLMSYEQYLLALNIYLDSKTKMRLK